MAQIVKHTIDAVYEDGAFRPLAPLDEPIAEGQKVRIRVETVPSPEEMTRLAASVYEGLSDEEIDEIEKIILDRSFFSDRNPT
jgi:predicted DNA-binding antitoxin AbrB/MazE fold protein